MTAKLTKLLFAKGNESARKMAVIIGLAALLRILVCFFSGLPNINTDSLAYIQQAVAITQGKYINFFPNGYPFIIAFVLKFIGPHVLVIMLWLNILCSTLIVYLVYDTAKKIYQNENLALLAALVTAIFPSQINHVRWILTEVVATFFLIGAYNLYFKKKYLIVGIFLGVATLIRTEILTILIVLFIADLIHTRKINFVFLAGAIPPLLLLGSYCYIKSGEFSLAGHNTYNVIVAVGASGSNIDFDYPDKHPEINTNAKATKMYIDYIQHEPVKFTKSRIANLWELWGLYNSPINGGPGLMGRIVVGLGNFFLLFFGLPAWWKDKKKYNIVILLIPFLIVTLIHVIYFALHRYVLPVEPFMIILAASGINGFVLKKQASKLTASLA